MSKLALVHGDVYPSFIAALEAGDNQSMSTESVNISGGVARTKGGWIGMQLFVMCPDESTAKQLIPALAGTIASFKFEAVPEALLSQLGKAIEGPATCIDKEVWPDEAGPLNRKGVHVKR